MGNRISKKTIATEVGAKFNLTNDVAKELVDLVFNTVVEKTKQGETVFINGLGTFTKVERAARNGINPKTKEPLKIPARGAVKFKVAKSFKEAVA